MIVEDRSAIVAQAAHDGALAGIQEGVLLIENAAKSYAPVRTGNLRRSIHSVVNDGGALITGKVGPSADYGIYLEFGTRRMAPRPYLTPAFEENKDAVSEAVKRNVRAFIQSALGGR